MFKVSGGHINPQYVTYVSDIEKSEEDTQYYTITLTSSNTVPSEEFKTYDEAVKNRGILLRIISPSRKRDNGKGNLQKLQEDK